MRNIEEIDENNSKETKRDVEAKHLPDEIITQHILPWLPLKPLFKSKLISKQWNFNVNFFLDSIKNSIFSNPFTPIESLFIQSENNTFYIYTCNSHDHDDVAVRYVRTSEYNLVELRPDFYVGDSDDVRLVGSCNGLVCLGEVTYGKYFILWNPSTNQSHRYYLFSKHQFSEYYIEFCMEQSCKEILWGFGYVSSVNDYKVVRVSQFRSKTEVYSVYVFSLRSNSWTRIEFGMGECKLVGRSRLVNETLYWRKVNDDENVEIISFDLGVETFAMLPDLAIRAPRNAVLSVMGGCLSVCVLNPDTDDLVMYIVKKLGRVVKVVYSDMIHDTSFDDLIGMTKSGKVFVVYPCCFVTSLVVSSSDELIVTFEGNARRWSTYMDSYVQSLVSPLPRLELPNASGQVNDDENVQIVLFDLGVETFAMLPDLAIRAPQNAVLSVMGGCLTVCVHNSDTNDLVMDIVKKLGRVVKVVYSGLRKNDRFADLIGMTQSGKIFIVYPRCCVICLVVSCSDKSIVTFEDNARHWNTCMDSYVQSLVSPLPPPELPNASGQVA